MLNTVNNSSAVSMTGPPHFVDLHVNPGESVSIQYIDGNETVLRGPATVTMISQHTFPPVPMPVQVPPGHMVQQIVDENGTLRHIILSAVTNGGSSPGVALLPQQGFPFCACCCCCSNGLTAPTLLPPPPPPMHPNLFNFSSNGIRRRIPSRNYTYSKKISNSYVGRSSFTARSPRSHVEGKIICNGDESVECEKACHSKDYQSHYGKYIENDGGLFSCPKDEKIINWASICGGKASDEEKKVAKETNEVSTEKSEMKEMVGITEKNKDVLREVEEKQDDLRQIDKSQDSEKNDLLGEKSSQEILDDPILNVEKNDCKAIDNIDAEEISDDNKDGNKENKNENDKFGCANKVNSNDVQDCKSAAKDSTDLNDLNLKEKEVINECENSDENQHEFTLESTLSDNNISMEDKVVSNTADYCEENEIATESAKNEECLQTTDKCVNVNSKEKFDDKESIQRSPKHLLPQIEKWNLTYTSLTSSSVKLKWTGGLNGYNGARHYMVEMIISKNDSNGAATRIVYQGIQNTCRVSHLTSQQQYSFRVRTCFEDHLLVSNVLTITTPEQSNKPHKKIKTHIYQGDQRQSNGQQKELQHSFREQPVVQRESILDDSLKEKNMESRDTKCAIIIISLFTLIAVICACLMHLILFNNSSQ